MRRREEVVYGLPRLMLLLGLACDEFAAAKRTRKTGTPKNDANGPIEIQTTHHLVRGRPLPSLCGPNDSSPYFHRCARSQCTRKAEWFIVPRPLRQEVSGRSNTRSSSYSR
jgi:hypothetical protein